jgi:biotin transport system substrate-specific component
VQAQSQVKTFVDMVIPGQGILRNTALIIGFAVFTAMAAQISATPPGWYADAFAWLGLPIEGTPVPITGQTLAIGITGAALGSYRAMASIMLYMLAGIAGLPVYAGSVSKVVSGEVAFGATNGSLWSDTSFLSIPSGGYIVGFIAAAYFIGWLAERGWDRSILRIALALLTGNIIIYLIGLPWLFAVLNEIPSLNMDLAKTLQFGLWPFIPGDILKLAIATAAIPGAWKLLGGTKGQPWK